MLLRKVAVVVLSLAAFTEAASIREEARFLRRQNRFGGGKNNGGNTATNNGGNTGNNNGANNANTGNNNAASSSKVLAATATCLNSNAVQTGSQSNGQNPPVDGQAASATWVFYR